MPLSLPNDWLPVQWPAPAHVGALCTTRSGGVSAAPRDTLNLGSGVGDDPVAVERNWATVQRAMQPVAGPAVVPVRMRQVHGIGVLQAQPGTENGLEFDACTTTAPGVACVALAADCLPVLFTDRAGTRVASAHAGWRGLAAGVLESALQPFGVEALAVQGRAAIEKGANRGQDILAWLGPCIGPQAFEVGAEVREAFCRHDPAATRHFAERGKGKWLADLAGLARQRLQALGVTQLHGNDSSPGWCTVGNPSRFFSYRRDHATLGASGRMAACIWLTA